MYNYKFDSDVIDKVIASCNSSIKASELNSIVKKLQEINNKLFFDDDVYNFLTKDYQKNQEKQNVHKKSNLNKIVINNPDAFMSLDLQSYSDLDKKYVSLLKAIEFEINVLNGHKKKNLSCLDIENVIRVADKISSLNSEIERIDFEISNCNKDIMLIEENYKARLCKFLECLKNASCDSADIADCDIELIAIYKKYQIVQLLDKFFINKQREEIIGILSNDNVKIALGDNYNFVYERYIDNVGADS